MKCVNHKNVSVRISISLPRCSIGWQMLLITVSFETKSETSVYVAAILNIIVYILHGTQTSERERERDRLALDDE